MSFYPLVKEAWKSDIVKLNVSALSFFLDFSEISGYFMSMLILSLCK